MAKTKFKNRDRVKESGNALLFILLGVVLFASLSFVMSRGFGTEGTSKMSDRRAELAATDILSSSRRMESAVNRLRQNNCSESELNFDTAALTGYDNTDAPADGKCDIFSPSGGNVTYTAPQLDWNNSTHASESFYNEWAFIGSSSVYDLGTVKGSCNSATNRQNCVELVMLLPYVKKELCLKLNDKLGVTNTSEEAPRDGGMNPIKFTGTFTYTSYELGNEAGTSVDLRGKPAGCYSVNRGAGVIVHHFYYVLLAR